MNKFLEICSGIASTLISIAFLFIPENLFEKYKFMPNMSDEINIIVNRIVFILGIIIISIAVSLIYMYLRKKIKIKGKNYIIQIEYGDINKIKKYKKVINFDECYTTTVGNAPSDIKPTSICGQYLLKNPNININQLIHNANLKASKTKSKFQGKVRYDSGKLVPNGEYLLMAFAKLDKNGLGNFF